ncbi:MAG TPA: DUF2062 domain-containing protein [Gammaproteobacteria bacterium]|jgi:hypothetical protein|nr:DUF2062 domain-containing protein [Gammaproteobacteria bacterium]|tara:strand:+ start:513 stop:1046 length:534 start_codon:yes stop_codon:yes gene_type:complete
MNLKKYLPNREQIAEIRALSSLRHLLLEPNLWHMNRYSLSFGFLIGGICCFLPIFFQTVPCVLLCVWIRCNVPLAVLIVWISNPITFGPMMYFSYRVGLWMLGAEQEIVLVNPSFQWFIDQLSIIWQPLFIGALACGVAFGVAGFIVIQLYYRWRIARYKLRKLDARRRSESDAVEP